MSGKRPLPLPMYQAHSDSFAPLGRPLLAGQARTGGDRAELPSRKSRVGSMLDGIILQAIGPSAMHTIQPLLQDTNPTVYSFLISRDVFCFFFASNCVGFYSAW